MQENIDESILLSSRVNENSTEPITSQILRIAIYDEFKAYESYSKIIETFGYVQPFVNIKEAEAVHYAALIPLLQKYNVPVPVNDWQDKIEVPKTLIECYELGVASEINNIAMYDHLLMYVQEEDIKDVLFKLQAASFNNHLPAFRNAVANFYAGNQEPMSQENIMEKLGEYQLLMDDILKGDFDQNKITQILSKLNMSMLSGAAFGSAAIALLNSYMNKQKEEQE